MGNKCTFFEILFLTQPSNVPLNFVAKCQRGNYRSHSVTKIFYNLGECLYYLGVMPNGDSWSVLWQLWQVWSFTLYLNHFLCSFGMFYLVSLFSCKALMCHINETHTWSSIPPLNLESYVCCNHHLSRTYHLSRLVCISHTCHVHLLCHIWLSNVYQFVGPILLVVISLNLKLILSDRKHVKCWQQQCKALDSEYIGWNIVPGFFPYPN